MPARTVHSTGARAMEMGSVVRPTELQGPTRAVEGGVRWQNFGQVTASSASALHRTGANGNPSARGAGRRFLTSTAIAKKVSMGTIAERTHAVARTQSRTFHATGATGTAVGTSVFRRAITAWPTRYPAARKCEATRSNGLQKRTPPQEPHMGKAKKRKVKVVRMKPIRAWTFVWGDGSCTSPLYPLPMNPGCTYPRAAMVEVRELSPRRGKK